MGRSMGENTREFFDLDSDLRHPGAPTLTAGIARLAGHPDDLVIST
jgi:hypothetical protein